MKILSALFFLAFLLPAPIFSQSEGSGPYLTDSSRSIQFGIESFSLRTFGYGLISYRQHCSASTAVRLGIMLNGNQTMREQTISKYRNDTLTGRHHSSTTEIPTVSFSIRALYQWYFPIENDLYLFAGIGPEAGYEQREYSWNESDERSWTAGIHGSVGAEWFASRHISLHAEYVSSALYRHSRSTDWSGLSNINSEYTEETIKSYQLNWLSVLFGLSVYF